MSLQYDACGGQGGIGMEFRIGKGSPCMVECGEREPEAVKIAAGNLKTDLVKVFGEGVLGAEGQAQARIRIRTLDAGAQPAPGEPEEFWDEAGHLRREAFCLQVQDGDLYITGTDRRGTIYGIYELCGRMGVSAWYFWADVPVKQKKEYSIPDGYRYCDHPSVEYRGIFINDEEELEAWVKNYMGEDTIGVKTYEKVFELLLRLKGNYIWPAMHVNSFNVKQENGALAEKMGIVVGTSHCDMLMRSNNREWKPWLEKKGYQGAVYDYSLPGKNREILQEYWRESVEQNRDFEVCYTLGMRGIHDSGFETEGLKGLEGEALKEGKIRLLQQVIEDQQKILRETLGREAMMTFIPYKEVLPLYDGGLEIPEDVTLVWANDNYGYIRRYPSAREKNRRGGNGIYYHNSYWAPPGMSYVFLCSIPLAHTANELRKAYSEGVRRLWVINTGAMKPLEQEIEFFLRLGWEIGRENALTEDVDAYVEDWINRSFSGEIGRETAELLNDFSQLTNVRKLEMMDYDAFSQTAYGDEAVVRIHAYESLFERGNRLYERLPREERDAFFQMVLMRIHAGYFTNLAWYYGDRSTLMYHQGRMQAAEEYTRRSRELEDARRRMLIYYNRKMLGGKWNGILNPEGFPPPRAAMMPVCTPPLKIGERGLAVTVWNQEKPAGADGRAEGGLEFTRPRVKWLEVGNTGAGSIAFALDAPEWLELSQTEGVTETECRILVWPVDTDKDRSGTIVITEKHTGSRVEVSVRTKRVAGGAHVEDDGMIAVEADCAQSPCFQRIKRLGRGFGSLMEACTAGGDAGRTGEADVPLEYRVAFVSEGEFLLEIHRFPSLDSTGQIRIGVSVDGGPVEIVGTEANDEHRGNWRDNVRNNVDRLYLRLPWMAAGEHTISFHAVDRYFAFSRFVIYTKERRENNYAGVEGNQALPACFDPERFAREFYGEIMLKPRAVEYACPEREKDGLAAADVVRQDSGYAGTAAPDWYLRRGEKGFSESEGRICIDCASVLAQSAHAYSTGGFWEHCAGESFGRSGLAMYIRKRGMKWESGEGAPSLNYRFTCRGGRYVLWLLAKFDQREEAYFGVGLDGKVLPETSLYCRGCLWRYEAEQIYRYVPLTELELQEGEHLLTLYGRASGLRYDRICLVRREEGASEEELPPMDSGWGACI